MYAETALRRRVLDPANVQVLADKVLSAINRRDMYPDERAYFRTTIGEFRYDRYTNQTLAAVNDMLAGKIIGWIRQDKYTTVRTEDIDSEISKQIRAAGQEYAAPISSGPTPEDSPAMSVPVAAAPVVAAPATQSAIPTSKLDQYYLRRLYNVREDIIGHANIIVDSRNRRQASYTSVGAQINSFQFSLNINGQVSGGSVTTTAAIRDIVRMRISRLSIPFVPQLLNTPTVGLSIEQLNTASYVSPTGTRMHFIFTRTNVNNNRVNLDPDMDGMFQFDKPVTGLDDFTVSFYSPFDRISFDPDYDEVLVGGIFTGNQTTIVTNFQHNLATGDIVVFSGFNTMSPINDGKIIAAFNASVGLPVSVLSAKSFSVPVNTGDPNVAVATNIRLICFFASKRISFFVELEYIRPFDTAI